MGGWDDEEGHLGTGFEFSCVLEVVPRANPLFDNLFRSVSGPPEGGWDPGLRTQPGEANDERVVFGRVLFRSEREQGSHERKRHQWKNHEGDDARRRRGEETSAVAATEMEGLVYRPWADDGGLCHDFRAFLPCRGVNLEVCAVPDLSGL